MFKKGLFLLVMVTFVIGFFMSMTVAEETQREIMGTDNCKMCHKKTYEGEEVSAYEVWADGPHAKAYETLGTEEAKKHVGEGENPQEMDACLKCHVTGHGVAEEFIGKKHSIEDGIGCESCHGAGGDYWKKKTMEQLAAGEIEPASVGLVVPTEETCVSCHNEESPTYKEFNFEEAVKQITHPIMAKSE